LRLKSQSTSQNTFGERCIKPQPYLISKSSFHITQQHHLINTTKQQLPIYFHISKIFNHQPPTTIKMFAFTYIPATALAALSLMSTPAEANGGFNFAPSLQLGKRLASTTSSLEFGPCQSAAASISPKPTYIIYSNNTVDINGLPPVCIDQLKTHNAQPDVQTTNKWEGWGIVLNDTAIQTGGVGNGLTAYLETIAVNIS
jgi:hypothetical protein